ncbi:hypothetical protein CUR178_06116 [Leishmania enriettii]|uniref:FAD linked oxidase N-terminal domain-containing protein n=1 Tax=Leishmania enriettii TaxID=5663 RepID=A0A836KPQ3_LEIEN|nr:hypothetical protein CUR178_06116 [Leishmania enriettii]
MNRILSIYTAARTITWEAGVMIKEVMKELDKVGLVMRCVPSYVQTTIGGCIATATHRSGIQ